MAQDFPPVPMAGLDMALADVALAKQLGAVLAALEGPCGVLRSGLVVPAEGPPWVRYVLFQAARGIALLDFAPARPNLGIAPLKAFLAEAGFASRYPGELPVVAIELSPEEIFGIGTLITEAFAAAPPCTISERSWCETVNRLLMTTQGLTMARVMPARGSMAPGPVRLAPSSQRVLAGAAPVPVLHRPRPALQKPATVLARVSSTAMAPGGLQSRIGAFIEPAKLLPHLITQNYVRPAIVAAGLSTAALAVAALLYLFDGFSPAIQPPATLYSQTEASPWIPRETVAAPPPDSTVAEAPSVPTDAAGEVTFATIPPATSTQIQSAAAEGAIAAPSQLVDLSEVASISDETAPAPVRSSAPIQRDAKAASVGGRLTAPSPAVGRAPIWGQPQRTAARTSPARLAEKDEPIWHDAPVDTPVRAAARASAQTPLADAREEARLASLVIATPVRDTR